MSRIAIVGAGHMGRSTLTFLLNERPDLTALVIDRSACALDAAQALAPERIDVLCAELSADMDFSECDLVLNLAGPFFSGSDTVARAAIRSGIPYVDIGDDVEATRAVLDLDALAREAGVALITGAGNSPGLTNWMAARLLEEDESLDGIQIVWVVHEPDPGGLAPLRHMLHMAVSPCPYWENGAPAASPGFVPATAQVYALPGPYGQIEAFDTAHPEPLTLPLRFPRLRYVGCKGSLSPSWANGAFSTLGLIGFGYHDDKVELDGVNIEPAEFLWKLMWKRFEKRERPPSKATGMLHVIGLRGSNAVRALNFYDEAPMSRGTGIGAAAASLLVLDSRTEPGAHGVEILPWRAGLEMAEKLSRQDGGVRMDPALLDLEATANV